MATNSFLVTHCAKPVKSIPGAVHMVSILKLFSTVPSDTGLPGYDKVSSQFGTVCKRLKETGSINTKPGSSANAQALELCITERSRPKLHRVLLKRT